MRLALIIYVKKYDDENIVDLKKTSEDATRLQAFVTEALPEGYQFETELLDNPTAYDVRRALNRMKKKFQEAERVAKEEKRDEHNLFLFFFSGHGFGRPDGTQYLLCSDALDVASAAELHGGIGPATLEEFTNGLTQTDVVFWLDACRGQVLRDRGDDECDLEQFRDVCASLSEKSSTRELKIVSCDKQQKASDDGLSMRLALDVMREKLNARQEILLGSTFTELWAERLEKTRKGNRQTPVAYGRPILLAPGVKSSETAQIESLQKQLDDALRTISNLKQPKTDVKPLEQDDLPKVPSENLENNRSQAASVNHITVNNFTNLPTPSTSKSSPEPKSVVKPAVVWKGTRAGERRELKIQGVSYGFCYCPPGTFMMGCPESEKQYRNREVQHQVTLTRGFWMLETPVTQGLWKSVMGNNPSIFCSTDGYTTNFPVENVSWNDCQNFIKKLNKLSGLTFQLPTEAQWEYACRAGTQTPFWWGNALNGDKANCNGRYPYGRWKKGKYLGRTCAVKSYGANPWGLYDCHGNVWEWCADWYEDYPDNAVTDPVGPVNASTRVLRGGGWYNDAVNCRSANRISIDPASRGDNAGFRLLRLE